MTCTGTIRVIYSIPGKVYTYSSDIEKILRNCKYRDSSGRYFGILKLTIEDILYRLRKFSIPGLVFRGLVHDEDGTNTRFTVYCSIIDNQLDVLPILYLDSDVRVSSRIVHINVKSLLVCHDLMICLVFDVI